MDHRNTRPAAGQPAAGPSGAPAVLGRAADAAAERIYRRRWAILAVLVVSLIAIVLDNTVLNVALKTIAEPKPAGLGASQSQLEWGINSYTLVFAGLLFTFGVIGDRIGRKKMLMFGMAAFGLFSLLTAYSRSPEMLIFARAAMGLGAAAVMPQTLSIISNVFDPGERARAIGIWATAVGIGVAIGPIVGGLLLAHFWWGSVFLINVPLTAAGVLAILLLVPESRNPNPGRIDYAGVVMSIVGLVLVVYGIIQGGEKGSWIHWDVLGITVAGLAVLALFGWYETRLSHPSLDVKLFRDPRLSSAVGALGLVFFGMMGALFFLSFYLQSVRGYSPLDAGLLTLPFAAGQMLMAPRSSRLVKRYGTKAVAATGLVTVAVALGGYLLLGVSNADLGAGRHLLRPGRGHGQRDAPGHRGRHVRGARRAGRVRLGADQHRPPGRRRTWRRSAGLDPGPGLPWPAQPAPDRLPAAARDAATGSISATETVASHLGHAGLRLDQFGDAAFVHAMHVTTGISAVITLVGALVVLAWMPGRPAAQADVAGSEAAGFAAEDAVPSEVPAGVTAEAVMEN